VSEATSISWTLDLFNIPFPAVKKMRSGDSSMYSKSGLMCCAVAPYNRRAAGSRMRSASVAARSAADPGKIAEMIAPDPRRSIQ
jgi:hypothetical protein